VNAIIAAGYLVTFMHRIANTIIAAQSSLIISHRQLQNGKVVLLDVYSEDRFKGMSIGSLLLFTWEVEAVLEVNAHFGYPVSVSY